MDETEELIGLSGKANLAQMGEVPGFELYMIKNCVLALTGEPLADFNLMTLGPNPDVERFFLRSIARAKDRGLPLVAIMSPHVAKALAPAAATLGLIPAGTVPLMVLRANTQVAAGRSVKVTRVLNPDLITAAGDLVAAAFDTPRDVIARCMDVCITPTSGLETYIALGDDGPVSVVTLTPAGDTAGISAMATLPSHQGQGFGRALLSQVIADHRGKGITRFHLSATPAGLPLYAGLGFETIADLSAWVLNVSN